MPCPSRLSFEASVPHARRYIGVWEIINGRLYLMDIEAHWKDESPVCLEQLFPGYPHRVFAHWFTGTIRCAQSERPKYVHGGFASTHERDLLLYFTDAVMFKTEVRHNNLPE